MTNKAPGGGLVVIRFSSMGDCVLATGVLARLAAEHPDLALTVVTKPAFRDIFTRAPGVHSVLTLDPQKHRGFWGLGRLAREIAALHPRKVIDLHGTLRARLIRLWLLVVGPAIPWSGIRKQSLRRRWLALTHSRAPQPHITSRYAQAALGRTVALLAPRMQVEESGARARSVALVPGAAWATKMWPVESYAELAERLLRAGYAVRVLGGDKETALAGAFSHLRAGYDSALSLEFANRPLGAVAAILAGQQAVVANDTGLMHLATAVGTPVVAVFGPTAPSLGFSPTGPHDQVAYRAESCSPCTLHGQDVCPRGHHRCMHDLTVDQVQALLWPILVHRA